jgi:hypothetical protein
MADATWEGAYNWQGYVLSGRPDLMNYVRAGDVTWERIWRFCRDAPAPGDAVLRVTRLFHIFLSWAYDRAGCWLDPEGEVCRELRAWARHAVAWEEGPQEELQLSVLAGLLEKNLVTRLYYEAAFAIYAEAALEAYAERWRRDRETIRDLAGANGAALPRLATAGALPPYEPEAQRFAELSHDAEWEACVPRLLARHYHSWNRVYLATAPDAELSEMLQDTGGEG